MTAALVGLACALLGLVLLQSGAFDGFTKYLNTQVFAALAGKREHIDSSLEPIPQYLSGNHFANRQFQSASRGD